MGASLAMIDRHYSHLARDGREHAVALLDSLAADETAWTSGGRRTRRPSSSPATEEAYMQELREALYRTRTDDPLLTMEDSGCGDATQETRSSALSLQFGWFPSSLLASLERS